MNGCTIITCNCSCKEQDVLHGKDRRVANYKGGADSNNTKCTCTCCGKETSAGSSKVTKPIKK